MRWVITRKSDDSLKARLVIQGFTDPQLGSHTYRVAQSLQERTTAVSDGSRVFENEGLWISGTALRTDRRTGTSTGTGTSSVCENAKIGVRFDRRSESLVGTCGDRHEQVEMANADH